MSEQRDISSTSAPIGPRYVRAHSPGPWKVVTTEDHDCVITNADGMTVADAFGSDVPDSTWHEVQEANARRIVACANALASIEDTDWIERVGDLGKYLNDLLCDRDELLAAARDAHSVLVIADRSNAWKQERDRCLSVLAAAIANGERA